MRLSYHPEGLGLYPEESIMRAYELPVDYEGNIDDLGILGIQRRIEVGLLKGSDVVILVNPNGDYSETHYIRLDDNGGFMDRWPGMTHTKWRFLLEYGE